MRLLMLVAAIGMLLWMSAAPPPAPSGLRFELTRLPAVLENHPTAQRHIVETMAGGIAAFDFDGDGKVDLFLTNGAPLPSLVKQAGRDENRLLHNEGKLAFRDVTAGSGLAGEGYSIGAAAADYDNDGRVDLFVTGVQGSHLYHNDGNGRFSDLTDKAGLRSSEWAVHAVWLDYDRDGKLDLFVVNYLNWSPQASPICHAPGMTITVYCDPRQFEGLPNRLYHNRGDGTFDDVSITSGIAHKTGKGMSAVTADYDGDGYPDIFVTNDTMPNFLFHNLRNGKFEEVALDAGVALPQNGQVVSGMGADFTDFDNDERPDIVFTALTGQTFSLFKNLGKKAFQDATYRSRLGPQSIRKSGWGVVFADFDNDGWKDVFAACSHVTDNIESLSGDKYQLPNALFQNLGNGTFSDISTAIGEAFQVPRAHRGVAVADFDNDGRLDVVVTVLGEAPELWHNITPGASSWMEFDLSGRRSNRDGIGAEIRVNGQLAARVSSQGYASSSLAPVHFGLGKATSVARAEIRWPSGVVQVVSHPPINRVIQIVEP